MCVGGKIREVPILLLLQYRTRHMHTHTSDSECEAPGSLVSSCSCHLTGVCAFVKCGSCVDHQCVVIVDLIGM